MKPEQRGEKRQDPEVHSAFQRFGVRAYRVTNPRLLNKTAAEIEAMPKEMRVFISRVRHDGAILETIPATVIDPGDVVAVMTRTEVRMARGTEIGLEADDKSLLDFPQEFLDVVITNKALSGKTLRELAGMESARGVFLRKLMRVGEPIPYALGNILLTAWGPVIVAMMA
jgi:putative transport protein